MARTGDIVINVLADSSQFQAGLQNDVQAAKQFAGQVNTATASVGGNAAGRRIQELGRGLEDFAVGYQLGGLSMGLRGVSNNVAQLASTFSPMAGGIAGIGLAVAGLLPMLINWLNATKDVEAANKSLQETLQRKFAGWNAEDAQRGAIRQASSLRDQMMSARTGQGVLDVENQAKAMRLQLQGEEMILRSRLQSIIPQQVDTLGLLKNGGSDSVFKAARDFRMKDTLGNEFKLSDAEVQKVEQLETEYRKVKAQIEDIRQTLTLTGEALTEAGKRQAFDQEEKLREEIRVQQERLDAEIYAAAQQMADGLVESLQTPREKFDAALKNNEFLASMGVIGPDLKRRADEQAVRELAKSSGYLGQTPKLTGALRGSAADFESRLASSKQTSDQLLEKQLTEAKRTADATTEFRRIGNDILKAVNQPPIVMEFQ